MQVRHKAEFPGVEGYELWKGRQRKSVFELLSRLGGGEERVGVGSDVG